MSNTLYDLTGDYLVLMDLLEDPEVDTQSIADALVAIGDEIEVKADGYGRVIRNMEATLCGIKAEQERLQTKRKTLENGIARLKDALQNAMVATGKRKFQTDLFTFSIQKNGGTLPVVVDVDVSKLPDELVVVTEKPDLKAIAKYIEETGDITYAHFGERGESLRIK